MLCDKCNETPATVHLTQIVNQVMTKVNLCQSCAAPLLERFPPSQTMGDSEPGALDPKIRERPLDCPLEVMISDPITVRDLAKVLHAQSYQVSAVLMQY